MSWGLDMGNNTAEGDNSKTKCSSSSIWPPTSYFESQDSYRALQLVGLERKDITKRDETPGGREKPGRCLIFFLIGQVEHCGKHNYKQITGLNFSKSKV